VKYSEAIQYLQEQLPMFQRQGKKAFKKDLKNIKRLCKWLNHPEKKIKCIHIAGTNGKGSTAHILASLLQGNRLRVGMYTSPHYKDFRERIKINANYIPKAFVKKFVLKWQKEGGSLGIQPSFFELTVAMAFLYFAEEKVDYLILETGLGGRLDSTNVVIPELSVITNIVFKSVAKKKAAKLSYAKRSTLVNTLLSKSSDPFLAKNMQTALAAYKIIAKGNASLRKDDAYVQLALKQFKKRTAYIGRWQKLSARPDVYVDSAHNEAGLR